jgi:aldose 1-epimerase
MVSRSEFGTLPDGTTIEAFTWSNRSGIELRAITLGCTIVSLAVPDRDGVPGDIVLGHDRLEAYLRHTAYFGAVVGRYANRIAQGRFPLDNRIVELTRNEGPHHLHGGVYGFDKQLWAAIGVSCAEGTGVVFSRVSPDGEEGYPGTLNARVRYLLNDANELRVDYEADTDRPTIVNLTQHSYFNLSAGAVDDVLGHRLTLSADVYTPVDHELIPTGALEQVSGTPFDFRSPTPVGARIDSPDAQLDYGLGYDHNWVIRRDGPGLVRAARLADPSSGRTLDVFTTEPGVQFYSGNRLDGRTIGKRGDVYNPRAGLCLETQHFPDAPNHPQFPSAVVRPGIRYRSQTVFRFTNDPSL